ncbi:MAG: hypothetical protein HOV77_21890 [Hamadaea sp.]|uniref:hypothetical protein n=1 Tax=Hamadaea sp. TaxID=2024425 RepID=UPI0017A9B642|nr:hypothetical protein [Hamadaea sp.]NUT21835.1 hypothetical protein [Hamadaea sp.]
MTRLLFAIERYDTSGGLALPVLPELPDGTEVRLVAAVHLPADDVLLALVEGPDADTVAGVAVAAGWRVDRFCPAVWVQAPSARLQPGPESGPPPEGI